MNLATLLYFTWDPSKGIEIDFYLTLLQFNVCFGLRNWLLFICKMFKIDHESEKKSLDTIFTWTLIGTPRR